MAFGLAVVAGGLTNRVGKRWQKTSARGLVGIRALVLVIWLGCILATGALAISQRLSRSGGRRNTELSPKTANSGQPNIVILSIDALRADHVGCYGYAVGTTPHIDHLAEEGIRYENAITQAPWTYPSFAALFTSLYPTELDIPGEYRNTDELALGAAPLDSLRTTLAEVLQQQGYQTHAVVTNPWLTRSYGFAQGFHEFTNVAHLPTSFYRLKEAPLIKLVRLAWPAGYEALKSGYEFVWGPAGDSLNTHAETVNHYALQFLRDEAQEPFFLWVHYIDPHSPYDPPAGYLPDVDYVSSARFDFLRRVNEQLRGNKARIRPVDNRVLIELYDAEIRSADAAVGQVIAELDLLGLRGRTIVIVSADHGEEFLDHGGLEHGHTLYGELTHIPLIMSGPEQLLGKPRVVVLPVGLIDVMPTLLELIGAPSPPEMEGQNLLSLERNQPSTPRLVYSEGLSRGTEIKMVRNLQFKLILDPYSGNLEAYDLAADPAEQDNLAAQEPAWVPPLHDSLLSWMENASEVAKTLPRSAGSLDASALETLEDLGY